MKRVATLGSAAATLALVLGGAIQSARAIKPFEQEFKAKYYKPDSSDPGTKALAGEIDRISTTVEGLAEKNACNVCHVGAKKKDRNAYGKEMDKLLNRMTDKDNKEKIRQALETVSALKSDPAKPDSPTFGELLQQGKLPGGN